MRKFWLNPLTIGREKFSTNRDGQVNPGIVTSLELALSECIPYTSEECKSKHHVLNSNHRVKNLTSYSSRTTSNCKTLVKDDSNGKESVTDNSRWNEVNIQLLSKSLYKQLFGNVSTTKSGPTAEQVANAKKDLAKHNLVSRMHPLPDVDLKLPPLEGSSIEEHFHIIGERQSSPYRTLLQSLTQRLPELPPEWSRNPGWTCYDPHPRTIDFPPDDALIFDVEVCMSAGAMPTLATAASPTCWYSWVSPMLVEDATPAVKQHYSTSDFIPLESTPTQRGTKHGLVRPRVVVGHNVSYDRARVKEQYWLEPTGLRFVDTMSMHICVSGITSYQRAVLKSKAEESYGEEWRHVGSLNSLAEVHKLYCGELLDKASRNVFVSGDMGEVSLKFQELMSYCAGDVLATHRVFQKLLPMFLDRFPHPVTLAGMLELGTAYLPLNENWTRYVSDANQTFEDLDSEARFLLAQQADKACQLQHNDKYKHDLWMWDQDWSVQEIKLKKSFPKSRKALERLTSEEQVNHDHTDVEEDNHKNSEKLNHKGTKGSTPKPQNDATKCGEDLEYIDEEMLELEKKFKYLDETRCLLPARSPHLPGYPAWYRKLCPRPTTPDWSPGPQLVSTSMQVTPKLLCLTWESFPLHYIRGHGWGLLVPYSLHSDSEVPVKELIQRCQMAGATESEAALSTLHKDVEQSLGKIEYSQRKAADTGLPAWYKGTGLWCNVDVGGCCWFLKLPHKNGSTHRVGNPLAKDFLNKFSENVLAGSDKGAERVLAIGRQLSYWRNNKERIESQLVVWLEDRDLARCVKGSAFGAIIPQVVVCGTLTRRAVEPTWMTASNAHSERVGSELRSMVQAPKGYSLVGADVDSQELWIASVIGDAHFAHMHGATPLGWMTLNGRKADGTDMHSVTAKAVGISRDHSKVINYARIYGAGQSFAEHLLKQFNPSMSPSEARSKAAKMFSLTKGKRVYRLKETYRETLPDKMYSMYEALKLRSQHGVSIDDMFERAKWVGGTESAMFNRLEEIASLPSPSTPFLNGRLSRSLEPSLSNDERSLPTRVNWVVQSGAVDFLHLMLVAMKWLEPHIRFCLSFHDEIRYIVRDELRYHAALSLHATNLLARTFCSLRLGLYDLPQSVAFFGSVEVDKVLRKEAHQDCVTPSNPHGLARAYGIPLGESLDIYQAITKAGNSLRIRDMSRATKRKHVVKEVTLDELTLPSEKQSIVRITASRGNNLHEVENTEGDLFLVSMPTKFRKNMWVKRGDFLLIEPIEEGDKVKGEIVMILTQEHIRYYKQEKAWPEYFQPKKVDSDHEEMTANTNRPPRDSPTSSSNSDDSEDSDTESK